MKKILPFGIELSELIDGDSLVALVKQHHLVLVRHSAIESSQALVSYAKSLGELLEWEFGNVMEMKAHEEPKNYLFTNGPVPFHWDGAFHKTPRYLLFHCIEAPQADCGGETVFSNTANICKNANSSMLDKWKKTAITYHTEKLAHYGGKITVPLLQVHPDTNQTILRFAEPVPSHMLNSVTAQIEGLSPADSERVMNEIAKFCYKEENCYAHTWQTDDFLIADNHALIHGRRAFKQFTPRHLRRIQVL